MGKVLLGTTLSLDGFMQDREGSVAALYPDLVQLADTDVLRESIRVTGAAVMGRHSYEMANGDLTGYEYQTPIFVITHHPPTTPIKGENDHLKVHFVTDGVESAIRQAKAAAGDKDVTIVGGADVAQQLLKLRLADELHIGIMPVIMGAGLRFFDHLEAEKIEIELVKTFINAPRVDLIYRIIK